MRLFNDEVLKSVTEAFIREGIEVYHMNEDVKAHVIEVQTRPAATDRLKTHLQGLIGAQLVFTTLPHDWKMPANLSKAHLSTQADVVNHPSHYNSGRIEVIEFIEDQRLNYHLGNTVKYICRAGKKDPAKEIEDLEKAVWYLRRRIEELKSEREGRAKCRPNEMVK